MVSWYEDGKPWKISRYNGELMYHRRIAEKCLAMMQARKELSLKGLCRFDIREFAGNGWTDTIEYLEEWIEAVRETLSPATYKDYQNSIRNHIKPFFLKNPVMLHDIQYDTLVTLLNSVNRVGKGKLNVMYCLHACLKYAWRSKRIPDMPPFPEKGKYKIQEPTIKWLTEDRQMAIINAIPEIHRPIFLWLKYHLRRPGEACALKWEDYDAINEVFIIFSYKFP
jgi:integrase